MWGTKKASELLEQIKGKSSEQIQQELDQRTHDQDELTRLRTEAQTKTVQEQARQTELDSTKSELQQAKERLATLERGPQPNGNEPKAPTSIFVDEDKALNERMGPLIQATFENSARMARIISEDRLRSDSREGPVFKKYYKEYEELVNKLSLPQRTIEASYDNVFAIVKGRHFHEIREEALKGNDAFFVESPGGSLQKPKDREEKLTDLELNAAQKMGVSPEQYLKSKKEFTFVGV